MKTSIRDFKARLSEHVRRAANGEDVEISIHGRPAARLTSVRKKSDIDELRALPGIAWNGGKPKGMTNGGRLKHKVQLSELVGEDRR
jgi:prevent-host-death family protein